jgi:hypothetical protein
MPAAVQDGYSTAAAVRDAIGRYHELCATFVALKHEFFEEAAIFAGLSERRRIERARRI